MSDERTEEWGDIESLVQSIESYRYWYQALKAEQDAPEPNESVLASLYGSVAAAARRVRRAIRAVTTGVADVPLILLTEEKE